MTNSSEDMRTYYNSISSGYDELHEKEQLEKLKIALKFIKGGKYYKILDIGCGSGISTRFFKNKSEQIIGMDPSDKLIEIAKIRQTGKEEYFVGEAEKLPFKDDEFDLVISFTAIQNFYNIEKAVDEMKRVGKSYIITFLSGCKDEKKISELLKEELGLKLVYECKDNIYMKLY